MSNFQKKSSTTSTTTEQTITIQSEENEEHAAANNVESGEVCILQCIFEKLEMVNHKSTIGGNLIMPSLDRCLSKEHTL